MSPAQSRKGEPGTVSWFMSNNLLFCHRNERKRCGPPLDRPTTWPFSLIPKASLRTSPGSIPKGLHAIGLGPDEGFKSSGDARGRIGKADDDSLIIDRCGRVPDIAADVAKINRDTVLPKHRVCHFLPSAGFVANGSVLLGLPPPWSM